MMLKRADYANELFGGGWHRARAQKQRRRKQLEAKNAATLLANLTWQCPFCGRGNVLMLTGADGIAKCKGCGVSL